MRGALSRYDPKHVPFGIIAQVPIALREGKLRG